MAGPRAEAAGPGLSRRAAVREVTRTRITSAPRESVLGDLPCLVMGSGPPLALLGGLTPENGLPVGLARWLEVQTMTPFAHDFEIYWVARRRGLAKGATMADLAADVADALAAQFTQPVDVLGISTGGSIAQQLAADHPARVRRLVLVSAAGRLENTGRRFQQEMAALAHDGARREVFVRFARDLVPPRRGRAAAGATMAWLGPRLYPHAGDLGDLAVTLTAEDAFDLRELAPIQAPTLIVAGGQDRFYPQALFAETARLIPDATLAIYPRRGHITVVSDPDAQAVIIKFLRAGC
jgi:pimeloyl-ACP methyl ester carboxylesterase